MVSIEKLMEKRAKEAKKLKGLQAIRKIKEDRKEIKEDIRKIQGAGMRAKYGTTMERVKGISSNFGRAFKGSMPILKASGKAAVGTLLALGQSANEYYGAPMMKAPRKKAKKSSKRRKKKK